MKELKNLEKLNLSSTRVTDLGLKELRNLANLTELTLVGTAVTDECIGEFQFHQNLGALHLVGSRVTEAGVDALRKALPTCKIFWWAWFPW